MLQGPEIDPQKTEYPSCGSVWQEHTLNQVDACMAIMKSEFSHAAPGKTCLR